VRLVFLVVGLVPAFGLPGMIYPAVASDIAAWALFAVALDLLLGYTVLLSSATRRSGGSSAYATARP
jgi:branched-chain amino acid transport system permease protein